VSAFQAVLLSVQLERLDEWLDRKTRAVEYITHRLSEIEGVRFPQTDSRVTRLSYLYPRLVYDPNAFDGVSAETFAEALCAEGIRASGSSSVPLYKHPLFTERRFIHDAPKRIDYTRVHCQVAESADGRSIHFNQTVLLSDDEALDDFVEAIYKVAENIGELKQS
jgi:dTDP-4-amino-4,6-dideoxygalactose transaminase